MRRRTTQYLALTLTLLGTLAVGARAQERERERAPERERTFTLMVGPEGEFHMDLRRGRMGINVDLRADAARDSIGARVAGVTPGGPADRAGVQTGDLITRVNGTRLAPAGADEFESRPAERLLRIASRLEPGDTVRLDARRGAQAMQFTFVAEASDMDRVIERIRVPMMREFQGPMMEPGEPRMRVFAFGGGPRDLELVAVNPGLGDYFGTTEGLLVVDVGADTALGLRAGDVILQVGGRRAQSPAHAMRILSTYEPGEEVRFDIMRQKRRTSVNGRMPQREAHWRVAPNGFEMRIPGMDHLEPLMRMHEPMLEQMLPRTRMRPPSPEIQHEEAPKPLLRTDGWT
jgi:hypothetical protein